MTKLKNTKKGMAKKALSISLVAAMLATSNVPVWAAEDLFTDGSGVAVQTQAAEDADVFTSSDNSSDIPAAAAPEAIDEDNIQLAAAKGSYYLYNAKHTANVDWKGTALDDDATTPIYGAGPFAKGSELYDQATEAPVAAKVLKYVWRVGGTWIGDAADFTDLARITLPTMTKDDAGKTLDLYFFEAADAEEDPALTLDFGTVKAVDVAGGTLEFTAADEKFTGKEVTLKPTTITVTGLSLDAADFTWSYSGTKGLISTGSVITVTGEVTPAAAAAKGIKGTVTGEYTIAQADAVTAADITVKVADGKKSYSYTGAVIDIPAANVSVTYKDTGYDLSGYVKTVQTASAAVADGVGLAVTLDQAKFAEAGSDFAAPAGDVTKTTDTEDAKVNITVLNLNDCTVEMLKSYKTKPASLTYRTDYVLKKDGVELAGLGSDVTAAYKDTSEGAYKAPGVYSGAVVITPKTVNVTGINHGDLTITQADFSGGTFGDTAITLTDTDDVGASLASPMKYTGKAPSYGPSKNGIATQLGGFYAASGDGSAIDSSAYTVSFENVDAVSTEHLAKVTVTGKSDYAGCKKVLYFKITPADVKAVAAPGSVDNSITTKVPADGDGIEQNDAFTKAEQYKDAIGLAITAKADEDSASTTSPKAKISVPLTEGKDYTVTSYKFTSDKAGAAWNTSSGKKYVEVKADITSGNVAATAAAGVDYGNGVTAALTAATPLPAAPAKLTMYVEIMEKSLDNVTITLDKETYTYTGKKIEPAATVTFGGKTLVKDTDYTVSTLNAINAGTAKVVINGKGEYRGKAEKTFTIEKADASTLALAMAAAKPIVYDGTQQKLTLAAGGGHNADIKLGDLVVSSQFTADEITYGDNVNAGKEAGTATVTASEDNKNFTGTAAFSFEIAPAVLEGAADTTVDIYNANGKKLENNALGSLEWTGKAATFNKTSVNLTKLTGKPAGAPALTANDVEVVYANNVDASTTDPNAKAYIAAAGKGNYTGAYSFVKTVATGVVSAKLTATVEAENTAVPGTYEILLSGIIENSASSFTVGGKVFGSKDITVKNGVYAGGMTVLPEVAVVRDGKTLVQDVDYTIDVIDPKADTKNASTTPIKIRIVGEGQYNGVSVAKDVNGKDLAYAIDKKDLKDCFVSVNTKDGKLDVTVMNGNVVEKKEAFDVKDDGKGTATVSVVDGGKNYTGSVDVKINDTGDVGQAIISDVKVTGNKATVILEGETDNAVGYDYVISTANDYKNGRVAINKNQLITQTSFQYLQKGDYYAYLHAWKRVNGRKVFGGWSNLYKFTVSTTTPSQPMVTSTKVSGRTVKVTYTKSSDATGYDIVLGSQVKSVNGEKRPVSYGKLVKKVYNGNTVTATFTNVPKGTYYAGLHAYNRSRVDNKKVFSPWSNSPKLTVR